MKIKEWDKKILELENIITKKLSSSFYLLKRTNGVSKMVTELIFYHKKGNYSITIGFIRSLKEKNLCRIQVIKNQKYGFDEKIKKIFINIDDESGILKTIHSYKKEIELIELFKI